MCIGSISLLVAWPLEKGKHGFAFPLFPRVTYLQPGACRAPRDHPEPSAAGSQQHPPARRCLGWPRVTAKATSPSSEGRFGA